MQKKCFDHGDEDEGKEELAYRVGKDQSLIRQFIYALSSRRLLGNAWECLHLALPQKHYDEL